MQLVQFQPPEPTPAPSPIPEPIPDSTPVTETIPESSPSPSSTSSAGNESSVPSVREALQAAQQPSQDYQAVQNNASSAGVLPSMSVGRGNGKRPNSNQTKISYNFANDVYIGKSFEPLRLCPYMGALEEAEEDDFIELGSLEDEALFCTAW